MVNVPCAARGAWQRDYSGSRFRSIVVRLPFFVLVQERLRGWWCSGWLSGRCPRTGSRGSSTGARTRYSGGYGDVPSPCAPTASGMSLQYAAWRCTHHSIFSRRKIQNQD
jgi:hypothetical protein